MFEIIFGIFAAIFAFVFLVVGVVALVGGAQQKRRCCACADGVVFRIHAEEQYKGKRRVTIFTPEFRYEVGGEIQTLKSNFGSMKREFKEGQAVSIRYDPNDPAVAYVADDANNSNQGGIMCVCFGLLLVVGAVMLFT